MSVMLPAYLTRAAIAAARYGPPAYRVAKRALSAGAIMSAAKRALSGSRSRSRGRTMNRNDSGNVQNSSPVRYASTASSASTVTPPFLAGRGSPYSRGRSRKRGKGSARKRSKSKKSKKKSVIPFEKRGVIMRTEFVNTITDANLMYIYVHDTAPTKTITQVIQALVRKICSIGFKRSFSNSRELIISGQTSITTGAFPYRLTLAVQNVATGALVVDPFPINAASTIDSVGGAMLNAILLVAMGNGTTLTTNTSQFTTLTLTKLIYDSAGAVILDEIVLANLNLLQETVHLDVKTSIKIQNRSVAADGVGAADTDTNNVNTCPLEGYLYKFSSVPKFKYRQNGPAGATAIAATGGELFSRILADTGHATISAATLGAGSGTGGNTIVGGFREPVLKGNFYNCTERKPTKLAPGALMRWSQHFTKSMDFNSYLKKIMYRPDSAGGSSFSDSVGGGVMLGLEDMINISTTFDITLTFQLDRVTKAVLTSKDKSTWLPSFEMS